MMAPIGDEKPAQQPTVQKSGAGQKSGTGQKSKTGGARSAARLGAVQALYQIGMSDTRPAAIIREFIDHRLGQEVEGDQYTAADIDFFRNIVSGTVERQTDIDEMIAAHLADDWSFSRIDKIVLAILRAGIYELLGRPDVPTKVVINEYVDVAYAFFDQAEPSFVNGVLDRLARLIRG